MEQAIRDRVVNHVKTEQTVNLCKNLLRIPSFKTEETKVARAPRST